MTAYKLATVAQVLVMPRDHGLAAKHTIRLTDLRGARLVVPPAGRPHREMLSLMLQSADVAWEVAVEASGWELMMQFVRLGLGIAVVNAYCNIPKGLVSRPLPDLPSLRFQLFHLRSLDIPPELGRLKDHILEFGKAQTERNK